MDFLLVLTRQRRGTPAARVTAWTKHIPTREALVEAVYAAELDDVTASAETFLEQLPPDEALRAWMNRYGQFTVTKRGIVDTLRAGWASGRVTTPTTRERVTATLATILMAGARAGTLRGDVDPEDVTALLLGVFLSTVNNSTPDQTARLLDLVIDALRVSEWSRPEVRRGQPRPGGASRRSPRSTYSPVRLPRRPCEASTWTTLDP